MKPPRNAWLALTLAAVGIAAGLGLFALRPPPAPPAAAAVGQDIGLKEFKQLCKYFAGEMLRLPRSAPFPEISDSQVRQLSTGYAAEAVVELEGGRQRVGCEQNNQAMRFVTTLHYD